MSRPLVIAHRGASGFATGNSLEAFRAARDKGADAVELDIHATADGVLVVHHDEMIGPHHVAHCNFVEVRHHRLANGELIPTLEEALAVIHPDLMAFVEIKSLAPRHDDTLLRVLDTSPAPGRVAIHAFDHRIVHRLGELRPTLRRGVLSASYPVHPVRCMEDADADTLWQNWQQLDEQLISSVHWARLKVFVWTLNDPEELQRVLALGVDGICTDYPDRARQAVDSIAS